MKGRLEVKKEPDSLPSSDPEYLSPSDQAVFVQETVQKVCNTLLSSDPVYLSPTDQAVFVDCTEGL